VQTLAIVLADAVYRRANLVTTAALVMTAVLLGGLLVRQCGGWLRIGFDGIALVGIYAATIATLAS